MSPQKKAIVVGIVLLTGILLALPFRRTAPPETEDSSNRVVRDIWLQKPVWNDEQEQQDEATLTEANLETESDGNADPESSLLQVMKDDLAPVVKPPAFGQETQNPSEQQSQDEWPERNRIPVRPKNMGRKKERLLPDNSVGIATLGSELVDLPPDVVVVERPADQFTDNDQDSPRRNDANQKREDLRSTSPARKREPRKIRHTVRDGDTIQSLAERYLGDSRRGLEIYNANRDLLQNPKALPIGDELIIIIE